MTHCCDKCSGHLEPGELIDSEELLRAQKRILAAQEKEITNKTVRCPKCNYCPECGRSDIDLVDGLQGLKTASEHARRASQSRSEPQGPTTTAGPSDDLRFHNS